MLIDDQAPTKHLKETKLQYTTTPMSVVKKQATPQRKVSTTSSPKYTRQQIGNKQ